MPIRRPIIALLPCLLTCVLAAAPTALAQAPRPAALPQLDAATRAAVVDSLTAAIDSVYVLAEPAARIVAGLRANLARGDYDQLTDPEEFAQRLESDAQAINHDGHFGIRALPPLDPAVEAAQQDEDPADLERRRRLNRAANYGFRQAEILAGGVGYLRFDRFAGEDEAFAAATAAMNFLANSNAVILDLRGNGGGNASMIRYLCGYLFPESTHLINWDIRARGLTRQSYSADAVPGSRLLTQPVYVLTSGRTFSAAEEFSFDLRNLERATLVGETTGGGGHTVAGYVFALRRLPHDDPHPLRPRLQPPDQRGLGGPGRRAPHRRAGGPGPGRRPRGRPAQADGGRGRPGDPRLLRLGPAVRRGAPEPGRAGTRTMAAYAGGYGPRRIILEDGALYYQRDGRPRYRLEPLAKDRFAVVGLDYFMLEFGRDDTGRIDRLIGHYDDGHTDGNPRDAD